MAMTAAEKCSAIKLLYRGKFMFRHVAAALILLLTLTSAVHEAAAVSEAEKTFLSMYFTDEELVVVSATRSLKSITRIAENVEVVTKEDIELMNAHSVADALQGVVGVQLRIDGGPRAFAFTLIQSSQYQHVAVFMDGIPLNMFTENLADVAAIPVQHVEKIEVIKGPASSAWGSSLGGVVNIITKSGTAQKSGGTLYGSFGEQTFFDVRADLYGKKDKTGYYFFAGRQQADGFRGLPIHSGMAFNDYYLKITHDLSPAADIVLTTFYNRGRRGEGNPDFDFIDDKNVENLFASLTVNAAVGTGAKLQVSAHSALRDWKYREVIPSSGDVYDYHSRDNAHGLSAKLTWALKDHAVVVGSDYDNGVVRVEDTYRDPSRDRVNKWAVYANDSVTLGKLSVTPGVRFDNDRLVGDFISPSLGITYDAFDKTLLRAYVARGFNSPPAPWGTDTVAYGYKGNPGLRPERVWSYQLGMETGILNHIWLKAAAFRHDISDAIVEESIDGDPVYTFTLTNKDRQRRQGVEVQFKTVPFRHVTFSGGAAYIHVKNLTNHETVRDTPKYTYDFSLKYDNEKSWKALVRGRYIWWDSTRPVSYNAVIVDANLIRRLYKKDSSECEVFVAAHNIFDGNQQVSIYYKIPDRWLEAGLRFKF